jgi:hypothetical protein
MKVEIVEIICVFDVPDSLMDKVRANTDYWADGENNLCVSFDEAMTISELQEELKNIDGFGREVVLCS